jgi:large subunit ribosomal protein L23
MDKTMILLPRLSEKTYGQSETLHTYAFVVPGDATKHTVARAVSAQFEVTVTNVNILNVKGKAKRTISRNGRRVAKGMQSDIKKAYVTLAEGQSIAVFGGEEETEVKEDKKAAKKAKKETK